MKIINKNRKMQKPERKFNQNDYLPKRFGLKYEPPAISK
jgi:hypothetical protein